MFGLRAKSLIRNPNLLYLHNYSQLNRLSAINAISNRSIVKTQESDSSKKQATAAYDGNQACANASYPLSESAFIYPITPASSMCELFDIWSVKGRKSLINDKPVAIHEMESEGGAAGALHGSAISGSLTTTFTASQGLLLMIPNLYELSGELLPSVLHVAARSLTKQALSIFGDHQDVMACRQTGVAMLCSNTTQECQDMAYITHMASVRSRLPFIHFFDGWRTSSVVNKIDLVDDNEILAMYPFKSLKENLRNKALNINRPEQRGTAQGPDIYFQSLVANNKWFDSAPDVIQATMDNFAQVTGRQYNLFDYYGDPDAERVMILMGSGCSTVEQTVDEMNDKLNNRDEKVGMINVRLFRPWSTKHLLKVMKEKCPNVKKIAVMDRTREDGARYQPLHLDILASLNEGGYLKQQVELVTGGQYGLSSKDFTPSMVRSVFDNLDKSEDEGRMDNFVIGINDDVTNTSLNDYKKYEMAGYDSYTLPKETRQAMFWGMGSDGTVGANKQSIKDIEKYTDLFVQGYFSYDAHKSGGLTVSHLRFGPNPIKAEYEIHDNADYISVNNKQWLLKFDSIVKKCKENAILVLNSDWSSLELIEKNVPTHVKSLMAQKNIKLYNIDAYKIAKDVGLGNRINLIMQAVFYKLANVLPPHVDGLQILRDSVKKMYESKGPKVIDLNLKAIDSAFDNIIQIEYPADKWKALLTARSDQQAEEVTGSQFVDNILYPMANLEGDDLSVSVFPEGGIIPENTSKYERRAIALQIPQWDGDKCTQCNYCSFVCPHSVIRPFLLNKSELENENFQKLSNYETRKAKASGLDDPLASYNYSIQLAPLDCTGCQLCVNACKDDALKMVPFDAVPNGNVDIALKNWEYSVNNISNKSNVVNTSRDDRMSVKGSQFEQPLLEFSGACAGCGETPYIKLITQLFGKNVCIANATGCSSIWGGSAPNNPYSIPWANSLFEDNAEFGFGMAMGYVNRRDSLRRRLEKYLANIPDMNSELRLAIESWLNIDETTSDYSLSNKICDNLRDVCAKLNVTDEVLGDGSSVLEKQSAWIVGGDGWAYDIGFGGLDHIINQNKNINIIVLDTEMYSNTGGQSSKSTPTSASVKFAEGGQISHKKDLGQIAMLYENVYVASISMGADYDQTVKALSEAEAYNGTSLVIALSPCISWGMDMKTQMQSQKLAVDSGYWPLYRFDPTLISAEGEGQPFQMDSLRIRKDLQTFLDSQNRFTKLQRSNTNKASSLQLDLKKFSKHKHDVLIRHSLTDDEYLRYLKKKLGKTSDDALQGGNEEILVLYGSETGNATHVAQTVANELKKRRDGSVRLLSMDDLDFDELTQHSESGDSHINVIFVVSTCGQGEYPKNSQYFMADLKNCSDSLSHVNYCVFGLGDSHYVYFNQTAKDLDEYFSKLGAKRLLDTGLGDDQAADKYDTAFDEWLPNVFLEPALGCDPDAGKELMDSKYDVSVVTSQTKLSKLPVEQVEAAYSYLHDPFSHEVGVSSNIRVTPQSYDRDFRQYSFMTQDISKQHAEDHTDHHWDDTHSSMSFDIGDCLGVWPENSMTQVTKLCDLYNLKKDDLLEVNQIDNKRKNMIIKCQDLFSKKLDIQGKPKRSFYQLLQMQPNINSEDKERLDYLLSNDENGKKEFDFLRNKEYANHIDLLYQFPSAQPSLSHLIENIPELKPRLYSIANSPKMYPNQIQLFVAKNDWHTATTNEYREGVSTSYLEKLDANDIDRNSVHCKIHGASIAMPKSNETPLILVGLGCGVAPLRAYIQDRVYAKQQGKQVGPMMLILGSRYEKYEYFYKNEFELYHDNGNGPLTYLFTAFSRDCPDKKVYVMDRISDYNDIIYDFIVNKKGYFYYCGSGGNVPYQVRDSVADALVQNGNFTDESAQEYILNMRLNGRYNIEAW